jgi:protein-tyrosine phosphatase
MHACILQDFAPTYVHCKAGRSRSVTTVMAYLIHANHWTLARAYAFVPECRKGISPNIGFVSELRTFEEQELGWKSVGVQSSTCMLPRLIILIIGVEGT